MAGGWYHITNEDGTLASHEVVRDMLENWGDLHEALDQLYGMVQWLAEQRAQQNPGNLTRHEAVEDALEHYREGIVASGSSMPSWLLRTRYPGRSE